MAGVERRVATEDDLVVRCVRRSRPGQGQVAQADASPDEPAQHSVDQHGQDLGSQVVGVVEPADVDLDVDERLAHRHVQPRHAGEDFAGFGESPQSGLQVRHVDH